MVELKPCPFCGGQAFLARGAKRKIYGKDEYRTGTAVYCGVCEARMFYSNPKLAAEAWNRRATMGECRDCAYSDRPIYKWPCDVCRSTENGRSMYCPEEADHIANDEIKTDYISRWKAQEAMTGENLIRNLDQVENGEAKRYARAAIRVLEQLEPADVRPVVPAKWIALDIYKGMGNYKCSVCNQESYVPECMGEPMYNFCPNCGAKMGDTP